MNYYNRLFCMYRYYRFLLILLVVLSYISPLKAQVYDVNITNNGVDVNVTSMPTNSESFFNSAYDSTQLDTTDIQFGDDSPTTAYAADGTGGTPYTQASSDFQTYSYSAPNTSTTNNPFEPNLTGRNPLGFSGFRYINFDGQHWQISPKKTYTFTTTPLQVVSGDANNNFKVTLIEKRILPNSSFTSSLINYTNFQNDVISAIIGPDTFSFITRLVSAINSTPTTANFVFNVPQIFGFNTGFQIVIPFADVLNGTGEWASFSPVISVFRSFMSLVYYLCVGILILRCIIFQQ